LDGEQAAEFIKERAMQDPKVQSIVVDAQLFHDLTEMPGWERLRDRVKRQRENFIRHLGERLFSGKLYTELQREIDYERGFFDGIEYFSGTPEKAMDNLEQTARTAYRRYVVDQLADQPPDDTIDIL
jgi:hypothetical protein